MTPSQRKAVQRHRARQKQKGLERMELAVPKQDRDTLRRVASQLREGGNDADRLRMVIASALEGEELINFKKFLEMAPLDDLELERSTETGIRDIGF